MIGNPLLKMYPHPKIDKRHLVILFLLLVITLAVRLWVLDKRWINPDEGAHLMDGVLVLDGKIPIADFGSRQPLYVYMIALFFKIFGVGLVSGRLFPLICSMMTGITVYLIARDLYDANAALLATAVYWMMPLELINSTLVKTEPFVGLLTCLSFFTLIRFWKSGRPGWLVGGGFVAALAYYVRESSLIIPLSTVLFLGVLHRAKIAEWIRSSGFFLAGYFGVFAAMAAVYSRWFSLKELIEGPISPVGTPIMVIERLISPKNEPPPGPDVAGIVAAAPDYSLYVRYLHQVFDLHSFLMFGLGLSLLTFCISLVRSMKGGEHRNELFSNLLLYLWIGTLFSAYAVYFLSRRGFYIDYFREFLPPLCILFAGWVVSLLPVSVEDKDRVMPRLVLTGALLLGGVYWVQSHYQYLLGEGFYASLAVSVMALITYAGDMRSNGRRAAFILILLTLIALIAVSRQGPLKSFLSGAVPSIGIIGIVYAVCWVFLEKERRAMFTGHLKFIALSIAGGALAVSAGYSAVLLNLAYDSPWSPRSVNQIAGYLQANTRPDDEVLSGAVIWELQASRRPFQMISHPLQYLDSIPEDEKIMIERAMAAHPPKIIILDGYTEMTYFRQVGSIKEILAAKYELMTTSSEQAKYPVRVYRLRVDTGTGAMAGRRDGFAKRGSDVRT